MALLDWTSRLGFRSLAGRLARLPLRLLPRSAVVRARGGLTKGMRWRVGSSTHGAWLGTYEPTMQAVLAAHARPDAVCYDVGANAGFFTLAFARLAGPKGHVFAFEPLAGNAAALLFHVAVNDLRQVTLVQAAVSETEGLLPFEAHEANSMGRLAAGAETGCLVPTLSLDGVVFARGLPPPHVIKIDVEGAEAAVLGGAARVLGECRPVVVLSLHGPDCFRDCLALLQGHGYVVTDLARKSIASDEPPPGDLLALPPSYPQS